jgi:hypothetical protein
MVDTWNKWMGKQYFELYGGDDWCKLLRLMQQHDTADNKMPSPLSQRMKQMFEEEKKLRERFGVREV